MHTARSRNDLGSTLARMNARDSLVKIIDMVLQLQSVLLDLAGEHTETVFTGYTHMQPAQPITFAYYLLAIAQALGRGLQADAGCGRPHEFWDAGVLRVLPAPPLT